jgi:hypothetical protein
MADIAPTDTETPKDEAPKPARKPAAKRTTKKAAPKRPHVPRRDPRGGEDRDIEARGTKNGAPGPKQHVAVRALLPDNATARQILSTVGIKTEKTLREIANGKADREAMKPVQDFGKRVDDPWAKGRWLAAIVIAAVAQSKTKTTT